jgi:hypothetical protein
MYSYSFPGPEIVSAISQYVRQPGISYLFMRGYSDDDCVLQAEPGDKTLIFLLNVPTNGSILRGLRPFLQEAEGPGESGQDPVFPEDAG